MNGNNQSRENNGDNDRKGMNSNSGQHSDNRDLKLPDNTGYSNYSSHHQMHPGGYGPPRNMDELSDLMFGMREDIFALKDRQRRDKRYHRSSSYSRSHSRERGRFRSLSRSRSRESRSRSRSRSRRRRYRAHFRRRSSHKRYYSRSRSPRHSRRGPLPLPLHTLLDRDRGRTIVMIKKNTK